MTIELEAFRDVDFGWVRPLESIWTDAGTSSGPNEALVEAIVKDLMRVEKLPNPMGRVLVGQAGIGKTHLVGELRRKTWASGGWFVLLDVVGLTDFWRNAALSFITSLLQEMPDGRRQFEAVLAGVARRFKVEREVQIAFDTPRIDPREIVDLLLNGLMKVDLANAIQHQDVFRALALLKSHDFSAIGTAHAWLQGYDADEETRRQLGFQSPPPSPVKLVTGMSWVMSLAGPTLVAVDQIDGVVNPSVSGARQDDLSESHDFGRVLAAGLLEMYDVVRRGMTVVTCLPDTWATLKQEALTAAFDRFEVPRGLVGMQTARSIETLIADRLAPAYETVGYKPTSATWPFSASAIERAAGMMPRTILMMCDSHRRRCLEAGKIDVCDSLAYGEVPPVIGQPPVAPPGRTFDDLRVNADLDGLLDPADDGEIGRLLRDVFDFYARQVPAHIDVDIVSRADPAQRTPPLHGRLTFTFHKENDREVHICFRALTHDNAISFSARLRAALTASGISEKIAGRHLLAIRRGPVPGGAKSKTQQLFATFLKAGGRVIDPSDEDLRTFVALRAMRDAAVADNDLDGFLRWLLAEKPLLETAFFKSAGLSPVPFGDVRTDDDPTMPPAGPSDAPASTPIKTDASSSAAAKGEPASAKPVVEPPSIAETAKAPPPAAGEGAAIPLGHRVAGAEPVSLALNLLPRHTAIIAGAGSGKTVLLRRLVEEAALAGVPAIVIDPNNDLSRLGDPWPEPPAGFTAEDAAKARTYRDTVEVVVWTPGIQAGNPLFLAVLPDFKAVGDDPDERDQAITMAVDTLAPLAGAKTNVLTGVLNDTLRAFAEKGGGTLKDMTALLADLPEGVSDISNAEKHAGKMADELKAAVANNPLLKATGAVLDPALLFTARDPAKTRISVINLSGLASDKAKQDFVNRLQMTLFGWIKKHPSPHGRLYVIDEAQNFVPSGAGALSKTSGVQLVAQARKYGLGMILVTQAPKGIDNKVVSNCTTQFLGKQNSPTDQNTVREMIAATGGRADDFGRLSTGEFYFKTEKSGKPAKIRTPICLSWHPQNPPTPEEVVERARASAI